ncbi:hypothetical protein Ahy_B09g096118 isoform A [Arachis hypogaea]|uniref:At2g35280-like TPR domain-containing protein n=1 Tax=Arachis hypogaea TaxID=3818 RepID=A0A444XIM9_ARAHY|nr:hypothetical protein Ahy_B09g096118 isoform A [Arachis hypogaea]
MIDDTVEVFPSLIFWRTSCLQKRSHILENWVVTTGTSKKNRKKKNVAVEYKCLINLLPRDIWVSIATKVASNSIQHLFNMQVTCKVFLDVATSNAVYKHASILKISLVSFLFYFDQPERRFVDYCVEARNLDAILRHRMTEYFWIVHRDLGMDLLTRATTEGSIEAGYLCAMLLLCNHEDEVYKRRNVKLFEVIRTSGEVKRCREVFTKIFEEWSVDEGPSDPEHPMACWSTSCPTRGTIGDVQDASSISYVNCFDDYEARVFLEMFTF